MSVGTTPIRESVDLAGLPLTAVPHLPPETAHLCLVFIGERSIR